MNDRTYSFYSLHARNAVILLSALFCLCLSCRPNPKQRPTVNAPTANSIASDSKGDPLLQAAHQAFERQEYVEAFKQLKKGVSKGAGKLEALELKSDIFKATNYLDLYVDTLKEWKSVAPKDPTPSHQLFFSYLQIGWKSDADAEIAYLEKLIPGDPRTLQAKALRYYRSQQPSMAVEPIATARKLDPKNRDLFEIQIDVLHKAGRYKEAESAMREFLDFGALSLPDQKLLLTTYLGEKKFKEALELDLKLTSLLPNDAEIRYQAGLLHEKKGDMKAAAEAYAQTVSLNRGFDNSLWKLGHAYLFLGRKEEGKALMREYDQMDKFNGEYETSVTRLETHPNEWTLHFKLAKFHLKTEEIPMAIVELKKTLQLQPKNVEAKKLLIFALEKQGRKFEAKQILGERR